MSGGATPPPGIGEAASTSAGMLALAGALALLATLGLYGRLLAQLRDFEQGAQPQGEPAWWFGYARDAVNLGATALVFGAVRVILGAGPSAERQPRVPDEPAALVLAVALVLFAYLVDFGSGRLLGSRRSAWIVLLLAGAVAVALTLERAPVALGAARLLDAVAPHR